MAAGVERSSVRLAEVVAVLSLGTDLGMGQPMDHVMRECVIALDLGERLGLDEPERATLYYAALLAWVGCHVDAHEQAKWFGDDLSLKGDARLFDGNTPRFMRHRCIPTRNGHEDRQQGRHAEGAEALGSPCLTRGQGEEPCRARSVS